MKLRVIGAVAAGTSAAAKARRNGENIDIRVYERDTDISYSACGLPYWLGGEVEDLSDLVPRNPAYFKERYEVDIRTRHEVLHIDSKERRLEVKNLETGEVFFDAYDKLVIATGAQPIVPPLPGIQGANVFTVRNPEGMRALHQWLEKKDSKKALVVGSGFIGLEMVENLSRKGLSVTLVELEDHVMKPLDADVSIWLEEELEKNNVAVHLGKAVTEFLDADGQPVQPGAVVSQVRLNGQELLDTDVVVVAVGIRPQVGLAKEAGVVTGTTGAIAVDACMETNIPGIYAAGDCAESLQLVTGKPFWHPLGSTANKMGRVAGDRATGGTLTFPGSLGTGIFRLFDLTVGQTGLSEREAKANGYEVVVCHNIKPDKPEYFHGEEMLIKAVADRKNGRVLGAQVVGRSGADKRLDILATAITFGARAEDLMHLDLAYAPPFSTTKDPVIYTGMILENDLNGSRPLITAAQLLERLESDTPLTVVDARATAQYEKSHVDSARSIPQKALREACRELSHDHEAVTYCNKGVTGNAAQNILKNLGFSSVYNLSGGHKQFEKFRKYRHREDEVKK